MLRQSLSSTELQMWSPERMRTATLVEDKRFDMAIGVVILANAIMMIVETDEKAACEDVDGDDCNENMQKFTIIGLVFLAIYVVELILKFYAYRLSFFQSTWNNFDFFLVTVSILSEVLGGMIPAISVARVFRAARLAKVFRVLMVYKELYLIIFGFASAMRAIFWASLLLCVLLTIWSIFAVELLHPVTRELAKQGALTGCPRCHRAFESVMASNLTFFQTTIYTDSWGMYALPIIEEHPALVLVFIGVWSTVVLGFGNLILAVIVECAAEARQDDLAYQERVKLLGEEAAMQQFLKLCKELDSNGSGTLSYGEFERAYNNSAQLAQMLKVMNIEAAELPMLFAVMDEDNSGDISYQEFANSIHKMRSSEAYLNFTFIKHEVRAVKELAEKEMKNMRTEIASLGDLLRGICANSLGQLSFVDPVKTVPEKIQDKLIPVKDPVPMRAGGGDAVVDRLFQHEVMLKLHEVASSVEFLVSKTYPSPADGEFDARPSHLLSVPHGRSPKFGDPAGSGSARRQLSFDNSRPLRTSSSGRGLPQVPLQFSGRSCGSCCTTQRTNFLSTASPGDVAVSTVPDTYDDVARDCDLAPGM